MAPMSTLCGASWRPELISAVSLVASPSVLILGLGPAECRKTYAAYLVLGATTKQRDAFVSSGGLTILLGYRVRRAHGFRPGAAAYHDADPRLRSAARGAGDALGIPWAAGRDLSDRDGDRSDQNDCRDLALRGLPPCARCAR
ncbi:MAG: hypothetical protein ABSF61_11370 [Anaerolineales bacterium]